MQKDKPEFKPRYSSDEFEKLGFHDCYVSGIQWEPHDFTTTLFLDYVLEWVPPEVEGGNFRFWVSPAKLRFLDVDDLAIDLSWGKFAPECQVRDLNRGESRTTPNGSTQWRWTLETAVPDGQIRLWASGFDLEILKPPSLSSTQRLE